LKDRTIYTASHIFTGDNWLPDHAIIVKNGMIESILPAVTLPDNLETKDFGDCTIAPAFVDAQIYGAQGKLLSAYPEKDSLVKLVEHCRKSGTSYCLPTIATNTKEIFYQCIDAVKDYWKEEGEGIIGLHLEGPWINPIKRGAHMEELVHPPSLSEVKELLNYGKGVIKMITLAPEVCCEEIIDYMCLQDFVLSAGHSNATYQQAMNGFEQGISAVTHLYNAMSPFQHREPGLAGAAMNQEHAMVSIIPDGHHVDYAAIQIAKKILGERLFAITDAVTETTIGPYKHYLAGDKYESAGILSGSALTMAKALYNLVNHVGIDLEESLRMCSLYPAKLLGLDRESGRIRPGYKADMVVLYNDLNVKEMICA
jgi:N-acetylglucosamine-6-phosphate deacetylase